VIEFVPTSAADPVAHDQLRRYFAEREQTFPSAQGSYTAHFPDAAQFVPPLGEFYVVASDGEAIGCGGIRRITDGPTDGPTGRDRSSDGETARGALVRFEVKHVWIRRESRGVGAGRRLMHALEVRAAELGAEQIVLDTNESLEAAGGLYRSTGYRTVAPYNDNPNATHWYAKEVERA
jgi:ribosomal protein S18 acetylase RimI-like enzyme